MYYIIYLKESDLNMTLSKHLNRIGKRTELYRIWDPWHHVFIRYTTQYSMTLSWRSMMTKQWKSSSGVPVLSIVGAIKFWLRGECLFGFLQLSNIPRTSRSRPETSKCKYKCNSLNSSRQMPTPLMNAEKEFLPDEPLIVVHPNGVFLWELASNLFCRTKISPLAFKLLKQSPSPNIPNVSPMFRKHILKPMPNCENVFFPENYFARHSIIQRRLWKPLVRVFKSRWNMSRKLPQIHFPFLKSE